MTDEFHAGMIVRMLKDGIRSSPFARWVLRDSLETVAEKEAWEAHEAAVRASIAYWEGMIRKGGPDLRAALDTYAKSMQKDEEDAVMARADAIKAERAAGAYRKAEGVEAAGEQVRAQRA